MVQAPIIASNYTLLRLQVLQFAALFATYLSTASSISVTSPTSLRQLRTQTRERATEWWTYRNQRPTETSSKDDSKLLDQSPPRPTQLTTPATQGATTRTGQRPCLADLIGPFIRLTNARAHLVEPRVRSDSQPPLSSQSSAGDEAPWQISARWLHLAADLMLFAALESDVLAADAQARSNEGLEDAWAPHGWRRTVFAWGALPGSSPEPDPFDIPRSEHGDQALGTDDALTADLRLNRIFALSSSESDDASFRLWNEIRAEAIRRLDPAYAPTPYPVDDASVDMLELDASDRQAGFFALLHNAVGYLSSLLASLPVPILTQIEEYREWRAQRHGDGTGVGAAAEPGIELDGMELSRAECERLVDIVERMRR